MKILIAIQLCNQLVKQIITIKIFCKLINNYLNLKASKGPKLNHAKAVVKRNTPHAKAVVRGKSPTMV